MGSKRIYLGREVSKYAEIAGGAILTITALFFVLMAVGLEITGSDDFCFGTPEDPCISYGKICNLGPDNYDIYNPESFKIDFSPEIKNYWIFFKDGRVKKEFLIPQGVDHSTAGWRFENFTNATKPRKDRLYVHRFARYSCQDYMLVGLKENPNDIIKWGVGVGKEYLDPAWFPDPSAHPRSLIEGWEDPPLNLELGGKTIISSNLTGATFVCVEIDHPTYPDDECGATFPTFDFNFGIDYFQKTLFNDSANNQTLNFNGPENLTVYVDSHQYDEVLNLSFWISGSEYNDTYPDIKIYVNNTLSNDIGIIFSGPTSTQLYGGATTQDLDFDTAGTSTEDFWFSIPEDATITSAYWNLTGSWLENILDQECSDDCELIGWGNWELVSEQYQYNYSQTFVPTTVNLTNISLALWRSGDGLDDDDITVRIGTSAGDNSTFQFTIDREDLSGNTAFYTYPVNGSVTPGNTYHITLNAKYSVGYPNYIFWGASAEDTNPYSGGTSMRDGVALPHDFGFKIYGEYLPTNLSLEVGDPDGIDEWNYTGDLSVSNRTGDMTTALTTYLDSCSIDDQGNCQIPGWLTSESAGTVTVDEIEINYTRPALEVFIDVDVLSDFLEASSGDVAIPLVFGSAENGSIEITNLTYDYAGGNFTLDFFVYEKLVDFTNYNTTSNWSISSDDGYKMAVSSDKIVYRYTSQGGVQSAYKNGTLIDGYKEGISGPSLEGLWADDDYWYYLRPDSSMHPTTNLYTNRLKTLTWDDDNQTEIYSFDLKLQNDDPQGLLQYNSQWHIPDDDDFLVYVYDLEGNWITAYPIVDTSWWDITLYGNNFLSVNTTAITIYNTTWSIIGTATINSTISAPYGMAWSPLVEDQFWIADYESMMYSFDFLDNKTNNDTLEIFNYYSDWEYNFPNFIDYLEFIPKDSTSKNVTPYGQKDSVPILNITTTNYGGKNMNFSLYYTGLELDSFYDFTNFQYRDYSGWTDPGVYVGIGGTTGQCDPTIVRMYGGTETDSYIEQSFDFTDYTYVNISFQAFGAAVNTEDECFYLSCDGTKLKSWGNDSDTSHCDVNLAPNTWHNLSYNLTEDDCTFDSSVTIKITNNLSTFPTEYTDFDCINITSPEVDSCVDLFINTNSTKPSASMTTSSWYNLGEDLEYLNNTQFWMWADYTCSYSQWKLWEPDLSFRGCCVDCTCSEELT